MRRQDLPRLYAAKLRPCSSMHTVNSCQQRTIRLGGERRETDGKQPLLREEQHPKIKLGASGNGDMADWWCLWPGKASLRVGKVSAERMTLGARFALSDWLSQLLSV